MNTKHIVGAVLAVGILAMGVSVFAQGGVGSDLSALRASRTPKPSPSPINLSCVASVVNARETSLDNAVSANTTAIQNAYTTRASALASAYTKTTTADVRSAVKLAWSSFTTSVRNAGKDWKTAQKSAWSTFGTAVKACGSTSSLGDGGNSGQEVSGN
jgi:hypothetical protein